MRARRTVGKSRAQTLTRPVGPDSLAVPARLEKVTSIVLVWFTILPKFRKLGIIGRKALSKQSVSDLVVTSQSVDFVDVEVH